MESEVRHWLGRWHGDPLASQQATALRAQALQRYQDTASHRRQRRCHSCTLQLLIAHYWLEGAADDEYEQLKQRLRNTAHGRALLELIYGQLLMSARREPAMTHLQRGFELASKLFTPADYLQVLKRHQQLALLPLTAQGLPAATLQELLTTAGVIERLQRGQAPRLRKPHDPNDLYG